MDKKKKIILIVGIIVAVIAIIIAIGVAIFENNAQIDDEVTNTRTEQSKYSWPDLTEYNIPNLENGFITKLEDESNKNNYILNYTIELKNIKKSELQEYSKKFDSIWSVSESENTIIMVTATRTKKYSIYINCDEEKETTKITITAL